MEKSRLEKGNYLMERISKTESKISTLKTRIELVGNKPYTYTTVKGKLEGTTIKTSINGDRSNYSFEMEFNSDEIVRILKSRLFKAEQELFVYKKEFELL